MNRAVFVGRVAGRHAPVVQERIVGLLRERRPGAEVLPEAIEGAVVVVPESARRDTELGLVAGLEERIAGMGREAAEEIGPQHRRHHRSVAAARLARDPAVVTAGERAVARVHPRDDLFAEIGVVATCSGRVEELAAAE